MANLLGHLVLVNLLVGLRSLQSYIERFRELIETLLVTFNCIIPLVLLKQKILFLPFVNYLVQRFLRLLMRLISKDSSFLLMTFTSQLECLKKTIIIIREKHQDQLR